MKLEVKDTHNQSGLDRGTVMNLLKVRKCCRMYMYFMWIDVSMKQVGITPYPLKNTLPGCFLLTLPLTIN